MGFWIRFFLFLSLLGVGYWGTSYLPQDVFISWGGWEIKTKTPFLGGLFLFLLLLWSLLLGGWRWVMALPTKWSLWWQRRQHDTGQTLVFDILLALEEEDLQKAEKLLSKSEKYFEKEPFFFSLQQRWAHLAQNGALEKKALDRLSTFPGGAFFSQKQQIERAITRQDNEEAVLILEELQALQKAVPWVLKKLLPLYREQAKFSQAEALLNQMKSPPFCEEDIKKERARLLYAQALATESDSLQQESLLRKAHFLEPSFPEVAVQLAHVLKLKKKEKQAQAVLETTWRHTPHLEIIVAYRELYEGEMPLDRFARLQHLAAVNPSHPLSLLALGQAALEAQLWVPARDFLMRLVVKKPHLAYPLLARLEELQHDDWHAACRWLEKGYDAKFHL